MAWPTLDKVDCRNFPTKFLPAIKRAMDEKMVTWGRCSMFADSCGADFEWAGCKWHMEEISEWVVSIRLVEGNLNSEDLTAALLRG